jgi:hypothetical protein
MFSTPSSSLMVGGRDTGQRRVRIQKVFLNCGGNGLLKNASENSLRHFLNAFGSLDIF